MREKLPSKSAIDLLDFEGLMAITAKFLYQYNLPIKKVNFVIYLTSGIGGTEQKRHGSKIGAAKQSKYIKPWAQYRFARSLLKQLTSKTLIECDQLYVVRTFETHQAIY